MSRFEKRKSLFHTGNLAKKPTRSFYRRPTLTNQVKLIRAIQRSEERKYADNSLSPTNITSTTGSVVCLNSIIAEGTDYNGRIGRKIRSKNLQYDIALYSSVNTAALPLNGVWHIVLDRNPSGTVPSYSTIFDITNIDATFAFKNVQQFDDRFKILKSHVYSGNLSLNGMDPMRVRGFLDLEAVLDGAATEYASSSAACPNVNAIYLCYAVDQYTVSTQVAQITFGIRYVYTDM